MTAKAEALYEAIQHVRPIHQYSAKVIADSLAGRGVTVAMRAVLERVHEGGPQPVPQIARSLWLSRQAVQRVVNEAHERGLVRLDDNPAHRRSRLVALTTNGTRLFDEIRAEESRALRDIAAEMSSEDIEGCVRVLSTLTHELRARASKGASDHGWSAPGPRPGEEIR